MKRRRKKGHSVAAALHVLLIGFSANTWMVAHDFWIEPSTFRPAAGSFLAIKLLVGEDFAGDPFPRNPSHIKRFVMVGPKGEVPIVGRPGGQPAGYARAEEAGFYVIGYRSNRSFITLAAEKFEHYLAEEGLEKIITLRTQQGQSQASARETYSRCAKALVSVGEIDAAAKDIQLHFPLELVAEKNPYLLGPGKKLSVRLLFAGKPLQGALVGAVNQQEPAKRLTCRSDGEGRAVFRLPSSGVWLVTAVHMIPAPKDTGADWESFWASLTFALPGLPD